MSLFSGLAGMTDIAVYVKLSGADQFNKDMDGLNRSADKAGKIISSSMTAAVVGAGAAFVVATASAAKFETDMAKVNTLLPFTAKQFDALSEGVLDIARHTPVSIGTLTKGLYDLISSGADASNALFSLEVAAQAASAGVTQVDVAIRAGMANVNAYGLGLGSLTEIYDLQFQAVNKGVLTYEEMAMAIGNVLPAAASLKVPLNELYGAIAHITKAGIDAQSTTTYLARAFGSMVEDKDKWEDFGVKIFDATGKFSGLEKVMGDVNTKLQGLTNEQKLAKLGLIDLDERAKRAILTITNNYDGFVKTLKEVTQSEGAMKAAFDKMNNTLEAQAKIFKNQIQASLIEMGNVGLPVLRESLKFLNTHETVMNTLTGTIGSLVLISGSLVAIWKVKNTLAETFKGLKLDKSFVNIQYSLAALTITMIAFNALMSTMNSLVKKFNEISDKAKSMAERNKENAENVGFLNDMLKELGKRGSNDLVLVNDQLIKVSEAIKIFKNSSMGELKKLNIQFLENKSSTDKLAISTKLLNDAGVKTTQQIKIEIADLIRLREQFSGNSVAVDGLNAKLTPLLDILYKGKLELSGLSGEMRISNSVTKEAGELTANYNPLIYTQMSTWDDYKKALGETNLTTKDYLGLLNDAIDRTPGMSAQVKTLTSSIVNMVASGFNPLIVAQSLLSIGFALFSDNGRTAEQITADFHKSLGELWPEIEKTKNELEELGTFVDTSYVKSLERQRDILLAYGQALEATSFLVGGNEEKQKQLRDSLTQVNAELEVYTNLLGVLKIGLTDIQTTATDAIAAFEYHGGTFNFMSPEYQKALLDTLRGTSTELWNLSNSAIVGSQAWKDYTAEALNADYASNLLAGTVSSVAEFISEFNIPLELANLLLGILDDEAVTALNAIETLGDGTVDLSASITLNAQEAAAAGLAYEKWAAESRKASEDLEYLRSGVIDLSQTTAFSADQWASYDRAMQNMRWSDAEILTRDLAEAGVELSSSIYDQIFAFTALQGRVAQGSYEYEQIGNKISQLASKLGFATNEFGKIIGYVSTSASGGGAAVSTLDRLSKSGIEIKQTINEQISSMTSLLSVVGQGSVEYLGLTEKIEGLKDKLLETTITLKDYKAAWESTFKSQFSLFDQFGRDAESATKSIEKMVYFGISFSETSVDEQIGQTIARMRDFLGTLDPNSAAFADAQKTLTDLKALFISLGGTIPDVAQQITSVDTALLGTGGGGGSTATSSILSFADAMDKIVQRLSAGGDFISAIQNASLIATDLFTFKVDLNTTEADEKLVALAGASIDWLAGLDPSSPQYQTAWKAVSDLLTKANQLQGVKTGSLNYSVNFPGTTQDQLKSLYAVYVLHQNEITNGGYATTYSNWYADYWMKGKIYHGGGMVGQYGSSKEVQATMLEGEYVLNRNTASKIGQSKLDAFNVTGNPAMLQGGQRETSQPNITITPNIVIHNANPGVWAEMTDKYVHPRIKKNELYTVRSTKFSA